MPSTKSFAKTSGVRKHVRRFDGKGYAFLQSCSNKRIAQVEAKKLREIGYKVRVTKIEGRTQFQVDYPYILWLRGRKVYNIYSTHKNRYLANKMVEYQKKQGYHAKVLRNGKNYSVYIKKKKRKR